jgi:glycosyltransferase involved in cell wall biosynthesis
MNRAKVAIVAAELWAGGIVYTHNLVRALAQLPDDERPQMTLLYEQNAEPFRELFSLVETHTAYQPMFAQRRNKIESLLANHGWRASRWLLGERSYRLAMAARRAGAQVTFPVFSATHRLTPRPIAWIPDFQHKAMPQFFTAAELAGRDRRQSAILGDPNCEVIFSSEHAREDAVRYFGTIKARHYLLRFATVPESSWSDDPAPIVAKYELPREYLMVCNQFWAHKGHATLFEALHILAKRGVCPTLVCTGRTSDYRDPQYFASLQARLEAWGIAPQVRILGMIPRYDQIMLMRACSAVMQPSVFEGWSTVLEDARALGKRIIATDFPVHVEQDLLAALYFRQGDAEDCARAIQQHLSDTSDYRAALTASVREHPQRVLDFARAFMRIVNHA